MIEPNLHENIFQRQFDKSTVFTNRTTITPHYVPNNLPFRDGQIDAISQILSSSLHGAKPDNLFIYGKVGTGKTVTVNHVLSQLQEFIAHNTEKKVEFAYVNCRNHNTKYKVLLKILSKFFPEKDFIGYSSAFVYEKLLKHAGQGKQLILVLG